MDNTKNYVTYYETGSTDPYYNLAFEQYVLEHHRTGEILMLWQNDNTIVVGQNQNTQAEINQAFVKEHGIHVVRRMTGGGAVYHDLGNLNYSFITDEGSPEQLTMSRFTKPIVDALKDLGLDAEASGRNDIMVSGKKVSGTAQRVTGGRVLHHGTLLFKSNPDMVAGALNADPEKFKTKSVKSVRARIGNISDFLAEAGHGDMDLPAFWDYLKKALSGSVMKEDHLSQEELDAVKKLRDEKYDTWEWNYGHTFPFTYHNKVRWDGGTLEVMVQVARGGKIKNIKFYGDFLAVTPLDELEKKLIGVSFRSEDVDNILQQFSQRELFGQITKEEVLETLFDPAASQSK